MSGPARARYGDSIDDERDARNLALPVGPDALQPVGLIEDVDRADVVGDRAGDIDGLDHGAVDARHRHDDSLLAGGRARDEVGPNRELARRSGRTGGG